MELFIKLSISKFIVNSSIKLLNNAATFETLLAQGCLELFIKLSISKFIVNSSIKLLNNAATFETLLAQGCLGLSFQNHG
jgi:hypothetical protein